MTLYMGVVLYAPSLALSAVTGVSKLAAVISIGLSCTFYSAIGGIKAVIVTDLVQGIMMFLAVYAVLIKGLTDVVSVGEILRITKERGHIEFFNLDLDPTTRHTVWGTLIGGMFTFLSLYAVNQAQIQRMKTLKTIRQARLSLFASSIAVVIISFSIGFLGLMMYVNYKDCDPLVSKRICKSDQLVPLFVMETFKGIPGMTGFFISGLMSGSLSTISTAINSLAAVAWEDFLQPLLKYNKIVVSPSRVTLINKGVAVAFGFISIGVAVVSEQFTSVLTAAMTIFGVVGGPILGLFTLGMMFPYVSQKAAVPSFMLAIAFDLWISFGKPRPPVFRIPPSPEQCPVWSNSTCPSTSNNNPPEQYFYLYRISYLWYSLIGFSVTIILGNILSLIYPQEFPVDEKLLSPLLRRILNTSKSKQNSTPPNLKHISFVDETTQ